MGGCDFDGTRFEDNSRQDEEHGESSVAFMAWLKMAKIRTLNDATLNHVPDMKVNVTLKIDAKLRREARVLAAEEGSSMSALLSAKLEQAVRERRGFQQARGRAKARLRVGFDLGWARPASRDKLYER